MTIDSSGNSGVDTRGRCAMLPANAMSRAPLLTVIVVVRYVAARLTAAIASVREQRFVQPEVLVVDPTGRASVSEGARTFGQAGQPVEAALNDAVAAASGEWILFLGADDRLVGDMVLSETLNWMRKTEAGVVAGESATDSGRLHQLRSRVNPIARDFTTPSATFYRRSLFAENGAFDPTLGAAAGYDFNLRLWKNRVRFKPIPLRIAACGRDAPRGTAAAEIRARHRYFAAWRCLFWDALSLLRRPRA